MNHHRLELLTIDYWEYKFTVLRVVPNWISREKIKTQISYLMCWLLTASLCLAVDVIVVAVWDQFSLLLLLLCGTGSRLFGEICPKSCWLAGLAASASVWNGWLYYTTILGTYLYSTGLWMVLVLLMRFTAISCLNEWRAGLSCELLSEQTYPPPLEKQNGHEVLDNSLLLYYCIVVAEFEQLGYMPSWSW